MFTIFREDSNDSLSAKSHVDNNVLPIYRQASRNYQFQMSQRYLGRYVNTARNVHKRTPSEVIGPVN